MSVDWNNVATAFTNSVNSIITTLTSLYDNIDWAGISSNIGSAMYTMVQTFNFENIGYVIADKVNSLTSLIVNAVSEGVYNAVLSAMQNNNQEIVLTMDGMKLTKSIVKNINAMNRIAGGSVIG